MAARGMVTRRVAALRLMRARTMSSAFWAYEITRTRGSFVGWSGT